MTLLVTRYDRGKGNITLNALQKIPKSSIIEYWLEPNSLTERIVVEVRYITNVQISTQ